MCANSVPNSGKPTKTALNPDAIRQALVLSSARLINGNCRSRTCPATLRFPLRQMIGTITKPATGWVHHSPRSALRSKPPSRIADRYVRKSAWRASAAIAALPRATPTRLLARDSRGLRNQRSDRDYDTWKAPRRHLPAEKRIQRTGLKGPWPGVVLHQSALLPAYDGGGTVLRHTDNRHS
jgi:hypothetical protein